MIFPAIALTAMPASGCSNGASVFMNASVILYVIGVCSDLQLYTLTNHFNFYGSNVYNLAYRFIKMSMAESDVWKKLSTVWALL